METLHAGDVLETKIGSEYLVLAVLRDDIAAAVVIATPTGGTRIVFYPEIEKEFKILSHNL